MTTIPASEYVPLDLSPRPIIGWRCWFVFPHEGLLRPIYKRGLVWEPRQAMEATCPDEPHEPPDMACKCGIWTTRELAELQEPHWRTNPPKGLKPLPGVLVVGQVALWGRCIEHERGWRASHAYPQHLYVFTDDAELAATLRDRYLVPVEFGETAERLAEQLPPDAYADTPAPPAASAPRAPVAARVTRMSVILAAAVDPLPDGALKALAPRRLAEWAHMIDGYSAIEKRRLVASREKLRASATRLRRFRADGPNGQLRYWYGADWKKTLVRDVMNDRSTLTFHASLLRAAEGDVTAARRFVWLTIAHRWRDARGACDEIVKLEQLVRTKRSRRTKQNVGAATIGQRKAKLERRREALEAALQSLADLPTPTYREWRAMFEGA